ncbi:esterase/lipase family protein [Virgisporangium aurantiacum]|nr:hypothetical protein [Virgisporangium aurantiacum]
MTVASVLGVAALVAATPVTANATGPVTLEASYTSVSYGWAKVERWYDSNPGYITANYPADGRLDQTGQRRTFFGNVARPAMGRYLLSYAPGWNTNAKPTPVLLVPGAYEHADMAWADPSTSHIGCGASSCPNTGLMQALSGAGYKVFALTFPHSAGNNYNHAQQIRNAVRTIRSATGAPKVDVVAWSMGAVAARMYVSGVKKPWGSPYGGDVRKLILIGGPNNGWDWTFRHGTYPAILTYAECGGAAIGGTAALAQNCYGTLYSHPELTAYITPAGDYFPGIRQMLRRWDATYPLDPADFDAYTTYNGGVGTYSSSLGINYAIGQGSVIGPIRSAGVPASISTYLLCGNTADIPYPWHNEHTGPSDGTIFTASCTDPGGIGAVTANTTLSNLNHLKLAWDTSAKNQIATWLN